MKKTMERKKIIWLVIIILVQSLFITFMFDTQKQGYHSDEIWNYGFANSSEGRHIYYIDEQTTKNTGEWEDSDLFLEYISVDESEIFDYKSVYQNAVGDFNPPLQYMLLHFICSFFPNVWSKWFCFFINIIAFIITQIYIYKSLKLICKDDNAAIAGVILYGFGAGALGIASFLRIYALGTAFVVVFFYYFTDIVYGKKKDKTIGKYIKLFLICFLGAFTIHQFLVVAFAITLAYVVYLLYKKRYGAFFACGMICLLAVVLSIVAFPATIRQAFQNNHTYAQDSDTLKTPVIYQFFSYLSFLTRDTIGIHNELEVTDTYMLVCLVIGALFAVLLTFAFFSRKKEWFSKMKINLTEYVGRLLGNIKNKGYSCIVLIFSVLFLMIISANRTSISKMGIYAKRYVFLIYPLFSMLIAAVISSFAESCLRKKNLVNYTVALFLALFSLFLSDNAFFMEFDRKGLSFDDIEEDANCIILVEDLWVLTAFTNELYDTNSFYAIRRPDYVQDNYEDLKDSDKPLYLFIDVSRECKSDDEADVILARDVGMMVNKDEILDYYKDLSISSMCELVGIEYVHSREIEIYRLNP